ncbi:MAG: hypothetical protein AAF990_23015 [Bacteroidota bacterium]
MAKFVLYALLFGFQILSLYNCKSAQNSQTEKSMQQDSTYLLSTSTMEVDLPIPLDKATGMEGLVEVALEKVINPDLHPVLIEVLLQQGALSTEKYIGEFSLFPANNPTRYLFDLRLHVDDFANRSDLRVILRLRDLPQDADNIQLFVKPCKVF